MNRTKYIEEAVLWICPQCGAYNLHPVGWEEFECINCMMIYHALAHEVIIEEQVKKEIEKK